MKKGKLAWVLALTLLLGILSGCGAKEEPQQQSVERQGKSYFTYFDTVTYVFSYAGDSEEQFNARSAEVSSILGKYHRLFDIYHEYDGVNNLCTLNRLAGGEPVEVDGELIDFLLYARDLNDKTSGEMDIMLGSVLSIWHEHRTEALDDSSKASVPALEELEEANTHTGFDLLEIDEKAHTVRITDAAASIDAGALGKGYATEKAAQALIADKAFGYVLNVGGNIRIIGTRPDGSGWVTAVRDPAEPDTAKLRLNIADTSCVTSGNYERYYTVAGVRYHHIIDKDTLFPAKYFASVTVLTPDSGLADALSTALYCMSYEDGLRLAESLGNVDALWIGLDGAVLMTDGMEAYLIPQE